MSKTVEDLLKFVHVLGFFTDLSAGQKCLELLLSRENKTTEKEIVENCYVDTIVSILYHITNTDHLKHSEHLKEHQPCQFKHS